MAADPPLADFEVSRTGPGGGRASIFACRAHLAHTRQIMEAAGFTVTVGPANRDAEGNPLAEPRHGCKGHMEDWPVT